MAQGFGRVSASSMDPSRKNRVPHPGQRRLLDLSGFLETIPSALRGDIPASISAGSRNETTQPKMIVNTVITRHDLCLGAPSLRNVAPRERGVSQSVSREY
jgi:hypothetical protein